MLPIVKNRKIWFIFSGILIVASIAALAVWHLRFGTDFTGGSLLEVKWDIQAPRVEDTRTAIDPLLDYDFVVQAGENNEMLLRMESISEEKHQEILLALQTKFGAVTQLRFDSIGPVLGQELVSKSLWGLGIMFAIIIIYIAWSFRKVSHPVASWKFGVLTVVAGFHDVIVPLGLFAVLGRFFGTEVNASFVAAILTILGYSITDTIVVFDRVRENIAKSPADFENAVEISVNQTLGRSINTSLTTILAMVAVYFFGGESVHDFALALIVGIIVGTYSSIFIASPSLVAWYKKGKAA